jgi:hypothetical protein
MNEEEIIKEFVDQVSNLMDIYKKKLTANQISEQLIAMGTLIALMKAPDQAEACFHIQKCVCDALESYMNHISEDEEESEDDPTT